MNLKPTSSWQEQLRTISSVITAVCLVFISVSIITTGVYLVHSISYVQETYHPEQLTSMISDIGDTVSTIHKTTHLLGSGNMKPLVDDFHNLIVVVQKLGSALEKLHIDKVLKESELWRNMSTKAIVGMAKSFF
tara:strand:+ start:1373 stop:1774 length:402 start_codon:yes stop_codon:yes gene_type:complete